MFPYEYMSLAYEKQAAGSTSERADDMKLMIQPRLTFSETFAGKCPVVVSGCAKPCENLLSLWTTLGNICDEYVSGHDCAPDIE